MSVLSILNRVKVEVKFLIPIIFVIGLFCKVVSSNSPAPSGDEDVNINVEKISFCDENLVNDRHHSKR